MKKILIVDDEPDILKVVRFRLTKAGYEIVIAVNGQEALDRINESKPDLILLDYSMPIIRGDEVCRSIRKNPETRDIPVILMTASIQKVEEDNAENIGVDDKILKPFEPEVLLKKIANLIK